MKRFLTFILAIAMIATLIPSAFADGGEGSAEEISIVCNLESMMNSYDATTKFSQINIDANGAFKYVRSSLTNATMVELKDGVVGEETMVTTGNTIRLAGTQNGRHFRVFKDHYICFEITIPENGYYTMDVLSQKSKSGQDMEVFVTDAETFYGQSSFSLDNLGTPVGEFCTYDAKSSYNETNSGGDWATENAFSRSYFYAGRYVITFSGIGGYTPASGKVAHAPIRSFTLAGTSADPGFSVKYDIEHVMDEKGLITGQEGNLPLVNVDYNDTNGFFDVISRVGTVSYANNTGIPYTFLKLKEGAQVVMNISVPVDGVYSLRTSYQQAKNGTDVKVYLDGSQTETTSYSCYSSDGPDKITAGSGSDGHWINNAIIVENISLSAGEHMIRFAVPGTGVKEASVGTFELITDAGKGTTDMDGFIKVDNTTLAVDETANILGAVACSSDGTIKAESDNNTVYESSDESIIKVDGMEIKAVGAGTADITTKIGEGEAKRTITVVDKPATGETTVDGVTFYANSNVDGDGITVTVPGYSYTIGQPNSDIAPGTKITLEATGKEGYIFRGWKRGSVADGVFVPTSDTTYSFPLLSNTAITAIYEAKPETPTAPSVEFYNFNGQFIKSEDATDNKTFGQLKPEEKDNPTVTGYEFDFWTMDGINPVGDKNTFNKLTRVMAKFNLATTTYAITIGDGINEKLGGNYAYDTKLELTANEKGMWKVNNKPVAYGDAYTHYVFGTANITFTAGQNSGKPILSLDTATGDAKMISYDANGAEIIEVGILFGKETDEGKPTIGSFTNGKAASKKTGKNISGQFTATGNDGTSIKARGYLIYNDKGTYRVIYAD